MHQWKQGKQFLIRDDATMGAFLNMLGLQTLV